MKLVGLSLILSLAILISAVSAWASEDRVNKSFPGLIWSTGKDESELFRKSLSEEPAALNENDELDGGFSSIDGMLQWAIGHSDPAKLKEAAKSVQHLSDDEIQKRQIEIKELMEKLRTPSDAELMKIAIDDLNNSSISLDERLRALEELLTLVEPIDNANDLDKLGGVAALSRQLENDEPEVRKHGAWVLGKASQNNPIVQKQVLDIGTLGKLIKMVSSDVAEEAIKALYAVSALTRSNLNGQENFYAEAGDLVLKDILSNSASDIRLRRKCVLLISDLALYQSGVSEKAAIPFLNDHVFLKAIVDSALSDDLDLQEQSLGAIKNLLQLGTTKASVFKDFCSLDKALDKMRLQLQQLMEEEDQREYAKDVEILRREVELIFHEELANRIQVPT